jgi:outer membrane protein assembly factor BamB
MKKLVVILLTILMLFSFFQGALRGNAANADSQPIWPMFHYNVQHTGQCPYNTSKNNGRLKWRYQTGDEIRSSPAIASDGTIYVGSDDKYFYAINPNGTIKWEFETGDEIRSSPAIASDGTIYVGSNDHYLYAINPNGTIKWEFETGNDVRSSPAIASDGTIYVGSYDHYLYAINPDGTLKWRYKTGFYYINSSPAIASDGTIYVGSFKYLYAVNSNGTLKWKYEAGLYVNSSPAIASDGTIYVGSDDFYLYAVNSDGTLKWKYETGSYIDSSPAIASDGTIYVGSSKYLYAIYPGDGTLKWRYEAGLYLDSSPAIASDGTIYVGRWSYGYDNYLYAVNPNGTLKWKYGTGNEIHSSPAIGSDGTIYIGSYDNYLYAIRDFTITASAGDGGSITPSGDVVVNYGANQAFTITPNPHYHIEDVLVDGSSVGAVTSYTFNNVTTDHTIEATFEINTYTIKATAGSGGSISPSGTITVNNGDSKTFTITPYSGYKISAVKADGVAKGSVSSYTFTNITSNHTIEATFEKEITQTVIILKIGNTTFIVNGVQNTLDSPPVIKNNRTLLPIRVIIEALGGSVSWDGTEKKVTITLKETTIQLWIGKPTAKVNGTDSPIDATNPKVVPEIINGRTMLPLRFVTENLGCDVQWDGTTKTVTITYGG